MHTNFSLTFLSHNFFMYACFEFYFNTESALLHSYWSYIKHLFVFKLKNINVWRRKLFIKKRIKYRKYVISILLCPRKRFVYTWFYPPYIVLNTSLSFFYSSCDQTITTSRRYKNRKWKEKICFPWVFKT